MGTLTVQQGRGAIEGLDSVNRGNRVSVVIPTFNRCHSVTEAIDSVLAQTVPSLEIIVVDDGSEDDTKKFLAPYFDHIVYIRQENQGVSAARNAGIRAAKGDLIAFLDSDDTWHPRKLEFQLQYLNEHPEVALIGAVSLWDSAPNWPGLPATTSVAGQTLVLEDIVVRTPFPTSTVVVRRHCFDAMGYFDTELRNSEDRDMYIRIGSRFPMVRLDAVLVWGGREGEHLSMGPATELSTRTMILGAFNRIDALRGRFFLKRRSLSQAAFEASYIYQANGYRLRALHRLVRSLALWPLPLRGASHRSFARIKALIVILMRLFHLKS
jgi:glycosyltransferase involved in cell wall biosynthesis